MSPTDAGSISPDGHTVRNLAYRLVAVASLLAIAMSAQAWEHEGSKVRFTEYREGLVEELREKGRPYFLLFSAEWCFWCHEFGENTLTDEKVAEYLNANYNSIFIDADINSAAYVKYRATGLPFTVFLNPDTSPHFRYAGTLYADDFLTVIEQIKMNVEQGLSVEGNEAKEYPYEPPEKVALAQLEETAGMFRRGVLENFDSVSHGLGNGEKAIHPRTFMYLLAGGEGETGKDSIDSVRRAAERAIDRIYDPVEGGFFRYAETREWKVPHYEKMADLNAGTVLLLFRLNDLSPSPKLIAAADKTLGYLRTSLYSEKSGVFLSFQEADEHYYRLKSSEHRSRTEKPTIIERVFIDRLAPTVDYLLDVLDYRPDPELKAQIDSSLEFVARELESGGSLKRYYTIETGLWSGKGNLQDYVLVARMFLNASIRLQSPRYRELARQTADKAIAEFHDQETGVLVDPSLGETEDAEFLMEMNGLLAETLIGINGDGRYSDRIAAIITYFSAIGEVLEERLWDAQDWEFTERYIPYLRAVDAYLSDRKLAAQQQ
ncbi:MAG: DUF255 domain-containing protein [Gammaproteobacteria bacterium]|nr:DUF255 domain-containing protein [Gammaproteobacteria bacterium]NIN39605.1 DUF255 domain-containing protein [Gammaproteobacteria bacterium]NIO25162.1 DUF255 domain-containing protein [Gammaproteobacteria bacterium]NIO65791.1 DUF255 domain-containing protein [Gammaproteobacteria bacterium]NIP45772.1 thioredoxin domain-containing protein [Gammaproteobacteria bacterium]